MQAIKIQKIKLLDIIRQNRDEHRDIFIKAQEKYRAEVIKCLDGMISDARNGKEIKTQITLIAPKDYTETYNKAIRMLELDENEVINLEYNDYLNYVEDEWDWSSQWAFSNSTYTSSPKFNKYQ